MPGLKSHTVLQNYRKLQRITENIGEKFINQNLLKPVCIKASKGLCESRQRGY